MHLISLIDVRGRFSSDTAFICTIYESLTLIRSLENDTQTTPYLHRYTLEV